MKSLRQYIREEITNLSEQRNFNVPPELLDILKNRLKMNPLIRYVDKLKAVNSVPPSYKVFLLNGQTFDLFMETYSVKLKIKTKEFWLGDIGDTNLAIKYINDLLTLPQSPSYRSFDDENPTPAGGAGGAGGAEGGGEAPPEDDMADAEMEPTAPEEEL